MQFPGFLHNLTHWFYSQGEGEVKGTADAAKFDANPVVQAAFQAAEDAGKSVLLNHVGARLGVEPTAQGITSALIGIVDNASVVPSDAKEPLKLLLGGLLAGSDFLAAPAITPSTAPAKVPASTVPDAAEKAPAEGESSPVEAPAPAGKDETAAENSSQGGAISSYKES